MVLRGVALALLLLTVLLFETVVGQALSIAGVAPNVVVVSALSVGMMAGPGPGLRYGFAAGIAVGLLQGPESVLGVAGLLLLLAGYGAGLARPFIAASQVPGQFVLGAAGVVAVTLAEELLQLLLGRQTASLGQLLTEAAVGSLYGALLTPLLCVLVGRLERAAPQTPS